MKVAILLCAIIGQCWSATTVEILAGDSQFSTLVSLLTKANLVDAVNQGTFTIFAPTNTAFSAVPSATLTSLGNDIPALTNILKYHVVQGSVPSSSASNELQLTTLSGDKVRFNIYTHNNVITVSGSQVTRADIKASNGIIHVINKVMMPPVGDIVDIVSKTADVSTLLSFVSKAGITNALKGDVLTVFAPTNDAFARLPSSIVNRLTNDIGLLTEILEYHVVPHTEYSAGLYNREFLRTIDRNHDVLQIHTSSNGVRINTNSQVTKADIGATNGVIHLIDHVLIPARYYATLAIGK